MDEAAPIPDASGKARPTSALAAAALERSLLSLKPQLGWFARRRGIPSDRVEDLIQDAATKVWERIIQGGVEIKSVEGYLRTVFARLVVDYFREKRPEVSGWGGGIENELDFDTLRDRADYIIDNHVFSIDRAACLERVLDHIEKREPLRGVALELAFQGISGRNMAEALGKSPSAANEFLSQTRKLLESLVREWCEEEFNQDG